MIQVKCANGEWVDIGEIAHGGMIEYREKPKEKKPDKVMRTELRGCAGYVYNESVTNRPNIELTFCGETGKLIKAEVL